MQNKKVIKISSEIQLMFWQNVYFPYAALEKEAKQGTNVKLQQMVVIQVSCEPRKKPTSACCVLHTSFLLGFLYNC
jgi:hypothetical protein